MAMTKDEQADLYRRCLASGCTHELAAEHVRTAVERIEAEAHARRAAIISQIMEGASSLPAGEIDFPSTRGS